VKKILPGFNLLLNLFPWLVPLPRAKQCKNEHDSTACLAGHSPKHEESNHCSSYLSISKYSVHKGLDFSAFPPKICPNHQATLPATLLVPLVIHTATQRGLGIKVAHTSSFQTQSLAFFWTTLTHSNTDVFECLPKVMWI